MKKRHIYLSVMGGLLLAIFFSTGYWVSRHNLGFTCTSSTVSFASNNNNRMTFNFTQSMNFTYLGKAVVHLSGEMTDENGQYVLNRTIVYHYHRTAPGEYDMHVVNAIRTGRDTVPESLENQYLMPIMPDVHRIVGIRKMPSGAMMISNNAGPYMICAVH